MDPTITRLRVALVGAYEVERELGVGGGGRVFLADDLRHGREVAIKVLDPEIAAAVGPERFLREIHISARLMHPHILPLLDSGSRDGLTWYVMGYAEGGTLRDRLIARGALDVREAVRIAGELADALAFAHRQGVVHRDVKPENILFRDEHALLGDFGIARAVAGADAGTLTLPKTALGTPAYMSPEQIVPDAQVTGASDQYALACVLYEMLCGLPPYPGKSATTILQQHLAAPVPDVRAVRPDAPAALASALQRAMSKAPEERFADMGALCDAITRAASAPAADEAVTVQAAASAGPLPGARPRGRAILVGAAIAALATVVAAIVLIHPWRPVSSAPRSLAVLPLSNVSGDAKEEYYADAMTGELIFELSKISALRVISRTSVMSLKGRKLSLAEVGRELGVDAVLEGTIAHDQDRLRVDLQLFQVKPEHQLWGERYDRPASQALELQTDIARAVVQPIRLQMTPAEARRLATSRAVAPDVHEAYLRGRFAMSQLDSAHAGDALAQFQSAIEKDPQFAPAWAGLAQTYYLISNVYVPPRFAMERVRTAASRALAIDPNLASAHAALGAVLAQYDWKFQEAEKEYREGLRLDPSDADTHFLLAVLKLETGHVPDAQREFETARALDPLNTYRANFAAYGYYCAHDYAEARRRYQAILASTPGDAMADYGLAIIDLVSGRNEAAIARLERTGSDPRNVYPIALLGYAYGRAGRRADAARTVARLHTLESGQHVAPTSFAVAYVGMGDRERALEWFRKAFDERDENMLTMMADPLLDPIRTDERYRTLIRRIGAGGT